MQLAETIANEDRRAAAAAAVSAVCARWGVNRTELSVALGLYAPPAGKPGSSTVNRWERGESLPSAEHQSILNCLADGRLELRQVGTDGRRRLFDVVVPGL